MLALAVLAPRASALSCPARAAGSRADVVFDGVALSGPQVDGRLISPARFAVLRYLKGGGGRVAHVETALTDELDGTIVGLGGELMPRPGEVWRIRGIVAGHRALLRRGDVVDGGLCRGSRRLARRPDLRPDGRSRVAAAPNGGGRWRVQAEAGRGALRCVSLTRLDRRGHLRECGRTAHGAVLAAVTTQGAPRHPSTVVVAGAATLTRLAVTGPDGRRVARAHRGVAALAFAGYVDPSLLGIRLALGHGRRRVVATGAAERVRTEDPAGGRWSWSARTRRSGRRLCAGFQQDPPRFPVPPYLSGAAFCARPVGGARFAFAPSTPLVGGGPGRVVLYGAAGRQVRAVAAIVDGRAVELPLAARGRAFLAVFPETVQYALVTLVVRFRDGRVAIERGRRTGVVAPPGTPRSVVATLRPGAAGRRPGG